MHHQIAFISLRILTTSPSLSFQIKYHIKSFGTQTVVQYIPFQAFQFPYVVSDITDLIHFMLTDEIKDLIFHHRLARLLPALQCDCPGVHCAAS